MRAKAAAEGREVRFGIRLHVIVRETEEKAWAAADDLIRYVDDNAIAASILVVACVAGVLTLAMALPWATLWPLLRFAAGVNSALVFVYTSG